MNGFKLILETAKANELELDLNEFNQDDYAMICFEEEKGFFHEDGIYFEVDIDKEHERSIGGSDEYGSQEVLYTVDLTIKIRLKEVKLFGLNIELTEDQEKELKQLLVTKIDKEI